MPTRAEIDDQLAQALDRYPNVPADVARRMMGVESGGDQGATSYKGARGLMQLMPDAAREMGVNRDDWRENLLGGVGYLSKQIDHFGSVPLGVAAYHAGRGAVEKAGGIPDTTDGITRTPDYVRKIVGEGFDDTTPGARMAGARKPKNTTPPEYADWQSVTPITTAPTPDKPSVWAEAKNELWGGVVGMGQDFKEGVRQILGDDVVESVDKLGDALSMPTLEKQQAEFEAKRTPEMTEAAGKKWIDDDGTPGPAFTDWRSYASMTLNSLPEQIAGLVPAMRAGSIAGRLAGRAALKTAAARGLDETATAELVQHATNRAQNAAAYIVGGQVEGGFAGGQSARSVRQDVLNLPDDVLDKSDAFKAVLAQNGGDRAAAKQQLAESASTQGFVLGYLATVPFAGIGDVAIARALQGKVGGGVAKRIGKTAAAEGGEEFVQSGLQQAGENVAKSTANPEQDLGEDVLNQAVGGAIGGIVQAAPTGALPGHHAPQQAAPVSEPVPAPDEAPAPAEAAPAPAEAGTTPTPTPAPAPKADTTTPRDIIDPETGEIITPGSLAEKHFDLAREVKAKKDAERTAKARERAGMADGDLGRSSDGMPFANKAAAALTLRSKKLGDTHEVAQLGPDAFVVRPKAPSGAQVVPKQEPAATEETSDAVSQPGAGEVLQREPDEAGAAGGERGRVEPSQQGDEPAPARAEPAAQAPKAQAPVDQSVGDYYADPKLRELAHGVRNGDVDAIVEAAKRMAPLVPKGATLVPVPGRSGRADATLKLTNEIALRTGAKVADVLRGSKRESHYDAKKAGKPLTADDLAMHGDGSVQGTAVLIDNVRDTGATLEAARKVLPHAHTLTLAEVKTRPAAEAKVKPESNGFVGPLPSYPTELAARHRAEVAGAATGEKQVVIPHPTMDGRFAVVPERRLETQPRAEGDRRATKEPAGTPTTPGVDRPPNDQWENDPGAQPGEPFLTLKNGKAAIVEEQRADGNSVYEATRDGGETIGRFDTVEEAAKAAEAATDPERAKNLPDWAREQMVEKGLDPNRPLNDVDTGNKSVVDAVNADPALTDEQKAALLRKGSIDEAAHEAATSPHNDKPEPTDAQKEAGNYEKGHVKIAGLDVSIENPAGSKRRPEWPTLASHYGYIRRTDGADGDQVDVFVKPGTPEDFAGAVYVVNQVNQNGAFDEHKVMLGYGSAKEARAAYLANYTKGWKGLRSLRTASLDQFKAWLKDGDTHKAFPEQTPEAAPESGPAADNVARETDTPEPVITTVASIRKLLRDPQFRELYRAADEPHVTSPQAAHLARGWLLAKAGAPLNLDQVSRPEPITIAREGQNVFNPVDAYRTGWEAATNGGTKIYRAYDNRDLPPGKPSVLYVGGGWQARDGSGKVLGEGATYPTQELAQKALERATSTPEERGAAEREATQQAIAKDDAEEAILAAQEGRSLTEEEAATDAQSAINRAAGRPELKPDLFGTTLESEAPHGSDTQPATGEGHGAAGDAGPSAEPVPRPDRPRARKGDRGAGDAVRRDDGAPELGSDLFAGPEGARPADAPRDVRGPAGSGGPQRGGAGAGSSTRIPARARSLPAGIADYHPEPGAMKREGSWSQAATRNLDAIELVQKLEAEKRYATPAEQAVLAKFVGWGAGEIRNNLFRTTRDYATGETRLVNPEHLDGPWRAIGARFQQLVTGEDLKAAMRSSQYAHYTSEPVVRAIWTAVERMGFKGGRVLEPGMGNGLFPVLGPTDVMAHSVYTGIELDPFTAKVAKYLLPEQNVIAGDYVKQKLPNGYFDAAIGNPPFARTKITDDPAYKRYRFSLHDYFFAKTIDKVRPGGLVAFVTSHHTMDKQTDAARQYLADRADLVGAIRMPQTAFKQNAGTEVTTDVLFLRKRLPDEAPGGEKWLGLTSVPTEHGEMHVNEYFAAHPEMVLGRHSDEGTMRGGEREYTVKPLAGDIEQHFAEAVKKLPADVYSARTESTDGAERKTFERDMNPKAQKEGQLYVGDDGELYRREQGTGRRIEDVKSLPAAKQAWLKDYVTLRDAMKVARFDQVNDGNWKASLKALNTAYDDFVAKNGPLTAFTERERVEEDEHGNEQTIVTRIFKNEALLRLDVESPLVRSLETIDADNKIVKGAFLKDRVLKKPVPPKVDNATDALPVSLSERGRLDLPHIAGLIGKDVDTVIADLGDNVFKNPAGEWELADEYLSGNVVDKLEEARVAAKADPAYERNVEALYKVQPKPLGVADITVGLGAPWVDAAYIRAFAEEHDIRAKPSLSQVTGQWEVPEAASRSGRGITSDWGTDRRSPAEILEAALNGRTIVVKDTYKEDGGTKTVTNPEDTAAANEKVRKLREAFSRWIWTDAERAGKILDEYNHRFNNLAPRSFDGSHLQLPGLSSRYQLFAHQKRAIWRIVQTGNTYLAHAVGAGKTLEMIVAGMEMKRLGLVQKPIYAVPNHMLNQFAREFLDAYPAAEVMVADEENFHTDNRKRFVAQAAMNNPDAIIITHSAFGKLAPPAAATKKVLNRLMGELQTMLEELEGQEHRRTRAQIEQRMEQLERRFGGKIGEGRDDVVGLDEMGVDHLFVDEAHEFRKLDFVTAKTNVKGITPEGSQKALDLYIKVKALEEINPGRSHTFASGTPITNTLGELYSIQRFMDEDTLDADGLGAFDSWAAQFGETVDFDERNAAGNYEVVSRFAKFVNVPELMARVRKTMDVLTSAQLRELVKVPKLDGGAPVINVTPPTSALKQYMQALATRIKTSRDWKPSKSEPGNPDPLIAIITDGRLAAIDPRYVGLEPDGPTKLDKMLAHIVERYQQDADTTFPGQERKGATQIVFSAVGFGDAVAKNRGFDVRKHVMDTFREGGIPSTEVAWMGDFNTHAKKEALFRAMREGKVRVLIGSPKNMGTGVNVQARLKRLHYLAPPWYPSDVEQPHGRILRQGNLNDNVSIDWYATQGTYDSTQWQMIARKGKFIEQALSGDNTVRRLEDISEVSQYEQASALASGDERVIAYTRLQRDIHSLELLADAHAQEQIDLRRKADSLDYQLRSAEKAKAQLDRAIAAGGGRYVVNSAATAKMNDGTPASGYTEIGNRIAAEITKAKYKPGKEKEMDLGAVGTFDGQFPIRVLLHSLLGGPDGKKHVAMVDVSLSVGGETVPVFNREVPEQRTGQTDYAWGKAVADALAGIRENHRTTEARISDIKDEAARVQKKRGAPFDRGAELLEKIAEAARLREELLRTDQSVPHADVLDEANALAHSQWEGEGGRVEAEAAEPAAESAALKNDQYGANVDAAAPVDLAARLDPPSKAMERFVGMPSAYVRDRAGAAMLVGSQRNEVAAAVQDLLKVGLPEAVLDGVAGFAARNIEAEGGNYWYRDGSITINTGSLDAAGQSNGNDARTLRGVIAHELGHHVDLNPKAGAFSSTLSPLFEIGYDLDVRVPKGAVMREAVTRYMGRGSSELKALLRYPLARWDTRRDDPKHTMMLQYETFAQLWRASYTNPELLRREMPRTAAVFEEIHRGIESATTIDGARGALREALSNGRAGLGPDGQQAGRRDADRGDAARADRRAADQRVGEPAVEHGGGLPESAGVEVGGAADAFSRGPSFVRDAVSDHFGALLHSTRTFNLWHRTVGTAFHKARVDEHYRPVYEASQRFIRDTSNFAIRAADKVASLLPRMETAGEVWKDVTGRLAKAPDVLAVGRAVFQATLRNERMTKAQLEAAGLTPAQVQLAQDVRASLDLSIDDTATSVAASMVRKTPSFRGSVVARAKADSTKAGELYQEEVARIAAAAPDRAEEMKALGASLEDLFNRAAKLKQQGYAPLMRFGKFTVEVRDRLGAVVFFAMRETQAQQRRLARMVAADPEYRGLGVRTEVMAQDTYKMFEGVSPETLELFANVAGFADDEMFQQYLKLAVAQRSAMKRMIHRKGIAGYDEDLRRVMASFITSNARMASRNYHVGEMMDAWQAIPDAKGDVKDDAGKLIRYVRDPQEEAQTMRGLLFVQYLGGSMASALVNMTQPVLMTAPYLAKYANVATVTARLLSGMGIATSLNTASGDLAVALDRARREGITEPQEIHQLYAESIKGLGSNMWWRRATKVWGLMFSKAETFNRVATFAAAFDIAEAMTPAERARHGVRNSYDFARDAVEETQGVYNRGNRPNIARGPIGATLFTFKQFSVAYLEFLKRLPPMQRSMAVAILFLASGAEGLPFAGDLEDLIDTIGQALGYNTNSKKALRALAVRTIGETAGKFLTNGMNTLPGVPLDIGARIGVGNLIPGSGLLKRSETDKTRDVAEALGPAGSLFQSGAQAYQAATGGDVRGAIMQAAPTAVQNAMKGVEMFQTGQYKDTRGRRVIDTTAADAALKSIGFQPSDVAEQRRKEGMAQQDVALVKQREGEIAGKLAKARIDGDAAAAADARAELAKWNETNPDSRIVVTPQQVARRVREMRMTSAERITKSAPREIRGQVREEVAP